MCGVPVDVTFKLKEKNLEKCSNLEPIWQLKLSFFLACFSVHARSGIYKLSHFLIRFINCLSLTLTMNTGSTSSDSDSSSLKEGR